jgi:hypothetical protein
MYRGEYRALVFLSAPPAVSCSFTGATGTLFTVRAPGTRALKRNTWCWVFSRESFRDWPCSTATPAWGHHTVRARSSRKPQGSLKVLSRSLVTSRPRVLSVYWICCWAPEIFLSRFSRDILLNEVLRGFLQAFQENARISPQWSNNPFLSNLVEIVNHAPLQPKWSA